MSTDFKPDRKVQLLLDEDIAGLDAARAKRWNINKCLAVSPYHSELPITIALQNNKQQSLQWLLQQGAELNDPHCPALITACQYCEDFALIELLLAHEADLQARDTFGKGAAKAALYGERFDFIPRLIALGLDVSTDGALLRHAVSEQLHSIVDVLLAQGVDVNFCQPDSVYPNNPTPVLIAAQNGDKPLVEKLLAHGADIRLQDAHGERPYTAALAAGHHELAACLQALEPAEWHSEAAALERLAEYQIPDELLAISRSAKRRMELAGNRYVRHIEFHALTHLHPITHKGKTLVNLLAEVDNYWARGFLVWDGQSKSLGSLDIEHGRYKKLGSVKTFLKDPSAFISKIFQ